MTSTSQIRIKSVKHWFFRSICFSSKGLDHNRLFFCRHASAGSLLNRSEQVSDGMMAAFIQGMRVTDEMLYRMINSNVIRNRDGVYGIQQQIASGKKVNRASDDPSAFAIIGKNHFESANIGQYQRNAGQAKIKLLNMDSILRSVLDVFHRASELAISAGDGTMENRMSVGHEVNQLLESLVSLANSSEAGSYVFSGLRSDVLPYQTEDLNGDGMIDRVIYEGADGVLNAEVGRGSYVAVNIPGSDVDGIKGVFETNAVDLFGNLILLRDRLFANENTITNEVFSANPGDDTITVQNLYATGCRVRISSTGDMPAGLNAGTTYFAIVDPALPGVIRLATSMENARDGVFVNFTSAGSGTLSIKQDILSDLNASLDHVINTLTIVGARQERIEIQSDILLQRFGNIIDMLDEQESLDIAEAMIELSQRQFAYEAALQASSRILNQYNLMDFLR